MQATDNVVDTYLKLIVRLDGREDRSEVVEVLSQVSLLSQVSSVWLLHDVCGAVPVCLQLCRKGIILKKFNPETRTL
jgi:hypothetical protein